LSVLRKRALHRSVADDKRAACAGHSGRAEVEKVHIYFILVGLGGAEMDGFHVTRSAMAILPLRWLAVH
jgi:hypothetical protein